MPDQIVQYTIQLTTSHADPERGVAELDQFLWRALYAKFGDAPKVARGNVRVLYDSYGDDMGHHPGHDHAIRVVPLAEAARAEMLADIDAADQDD